MEFSHQPDPDTFFQNSRDFIARVRIPTNGDFHKTLKYLKENNTGICVLTLVDLGTFSNKEFTAKVLTTLIERDFVEKHITSELITDIDLRTGYRITTNGKLFFKILPTLDWLKKNRIRIIKTLALCVILSLIIIFYKQLINLIPDRENFASIKTHLVNNGTLYSLVIGFIGLVFSFIALFKKS